MCNTAAGLTPDQPDQVPTTSQVALHGDQQLLASTAGHLKGFQDTNLFLV
jgi:hypothetical protein